MRKLKAVDDTKYGQDAEYANTVDAIARGVSAEDGDKETALRLLFMGLEAGDVAKGVAAHRLIHRCRSANWEEYDGLRADLALLRSQLPPDNGLITHVSRIENGLRDRSSTLILLYLLLGVPVSVLVGALAAGASILAATYVPPETTEFWNELKDGLAGVLSWLFVFPLAAANRLAKTYRTPLIDPSKKWTLIIHSLLMFGGLMFGDYFLQVYLANISASLSHFGASVLDSARSSWLFAFPLVVIAANLHRASGFSGGSGQSDDNITDDVDDILGGFGLPSIGWLVNAAISVPISALIRGVLFLLGK